MKKNKEYAYDAENDIVYEAWYDENNDYVTKLKIHNLHSAPIVVKDVLPTNYHYQKFVKCQEQNKIDLIKNGLTDEFKHLLKASAIAGYGITKEDEYDNIMTYDDYTSHYRKLNKALRYIMNVTAPDRF